MGQQAERSFNLVQGRIVWANILDPQKKNPKNRRCILISEPAVIAKGGILRIVGITTELNASPPEHYVELQFGQNCSTALTEKCAALGTWVVDLPSSELEATKGFLRPTYLEKVLQLVDKLEAAGHPIPCY